MDENGSAVDRLSTSANRNRKLCKISPQAVYLSRQGYPYQRCCA